ncbi:hypothetical protein [Brevundimonas lenta]|uniref:hypothetical protein n=1 Tax=Brevundimonas lenta TaxID=424796 RepID=UPI0031E204E8
MARWRKPALITASVVAHVIVLGLLSYRAMGLAYRPLPAPPPVVYVEIEPRPLLEGEKARPRPTPVEPTAEPERQPSPATAEASSSITSFRLPFQRQRDDEEDQPSPPAPRLAAPAAAPPPAGVEAWTVRPETLGDRVGRGLRTRGPGCANPQLLTEAERAICDDRFAARAAAAPPVSGTGNPERDARFAREGARALAEYEARRQPLAGGVGVVGPQDGPGSNFGMGVAGAHIDPSLRPDSTTNVRTRRDRIREAEED